MKCPGGDTSTSNIDSGDTTFVMMGATFVFLMTPGLGFFYGGMARSKHFLSTIITSLLCIGLVTVQWFIWGYSLTFSVTGSSNFFGNLDYAVLRNVNNDPHCNAPTVPGTAFMFYQLMFAIITPALAFGAAAERATMHAFMIWTFIWSTVVYDVIAYWTWNPNGWLFKLGALDFAGGGPVHLASGSAALAYALVLGRRKGFGKEKFVPHNLAHVILGTALLWFGWFGFNGVSELRAEGRAVNAMIVTQIAASVGGLSWMILEGISKKKLSSFGFCSGAVVGLVAITPAAGYVTPGPSFVFGFLGATFSFLATEIKHWIGVDDAFDVFAVHGVGAITGSILTGIFAYSYVWTLNGGEATTGGWLDKHWEQVGYQLAAICSTFLWSFGISFIILKIMDWIPGLGVRVPEEHESIGTDFASLGETAYSKSLMGFAIPRDKDDKDEEKLLKSPNEEEKLLNQTHSTKPVDKTQQRQLPSDKPLNSTKTARGKLEVENGIDKLGENMDKSSKRGSSFSSHVTEINMDEMEAEAPPSKRGSVQLDGAIPIDIAQESANPEGGFKKRKVSNEKQTEPEKRTPEESVSETDKTKQNESDFESTEARIRLADPSRDCCQCLVS